jgi:hypothetical protein
MKKRLGKAAAAAVMLFAFGLGSLLALPCVAVALLGFAVTGREGFGRYVSYRGKSFDQVCNTYWFNGHPKETISSHAGRYFEAKYGNPYKGRPATDPELVIPRWARAIAWLTNLAEADHCLKAVESAFVGMPLEE